MLPSLYLCILLVLPLSALVCKEERLHHVPRIYGMGLTDYSREVGIYSWEQQNQHGRGRAEDPLSGLACMGSMGISHFNVVMF